MDNKIDIILVQFKKVYFKKEQKNKNKKLEQYGLSNFLKKVLL